MRSIGSYFLLPFFLLSLGLLCEEDPSSEEVADNGEMQDTLSYNVGFLIMDGVYNTELTAPYDIFQHTKFREGIRPMRVFTLARGLDEVVTFEGLRIVPDYDYREEDYPGIDILVVPSAEHHLDSDLDDEVMIDFVRRTSAAAEYVMSLCDGAFVLAQAGLLDSVASTTFPGDLEFYEEKFPQLDIRKDAYLVHDGKYITSAGGARSFDAALYLCEYLYGKEIADRLAQGLVIDWDIQKIKAEVIYN